MVTEMKRASNVLKFFSTNMRIVTPLLNAMLHYTAFPCLPAEPESNVNTGL